MYGVSAARSKIRCCLRSLFAPHVLRAYICRFSIILWRYMVILTSWCLESLVWVVSWVWTKSVFDSVVGAGSLRPVTHWRWLNVGGCGLVIDAEGGVCLGSYEIAMHGKLISPAAEDVAHIWTRVWIRFLPNGIWICGPFGCALDN